VFGMLLQPAALGCEGQMIIAGSSELELLQAKNNVNQWQCL